MFYQEAEANRAEATENALAAINKAYQDVKAKLESIGYVNTGDHIAGHTSMERTRRSEIERAQTACPMCVRKDAANS